MEHYIKNVNDITYQSELILDIFLSLGLSSISTLVSKNVKD